MAYSINQQTSYFLRQKGLTLSDLEQHPCIDDLILLANIRTSIFVDFNRSQRAFFNGLWGVVKQQRHKLKEKHLNKLTDIISDIEQARIKIKSLRQ